MTQSTTPTMIETTVTRSMRVVLSVFAAVMVLALYMKTADPTNDIKWLFFTWGTFVLGIWWIAYIWWFKGQTRRPVVFLETQVLFLLFFIAATAKSEFIGTSMAETARFCGLFMLYLISAQVFSKPEQVRSWMAISCIAVALASVYGFAQYAGMDPIEWAGKDSDVYLNLPATFGNPNFAAHTLILVLIMALYLQLTKPNSFWFLILIICGGHFIATGQRAGMVGLAAAAVLIGVAWLLRKTRRPVLATLCTMFILAVVLCCAAVAVMYGMWLRTGTPFPLDASLLLRYQAYIGATDIILDAPLLGHGPGVYPIINPLYWTLYEQHWFAQELRMNAHVHNDNLELAIDAGLPAAGLYLVMLVLGMCHGLTMAFSATECNRRAMGYTFAALFCAFLVDGCFGFNLRVPVSAAFLFILFGALDGLVSSPQPAKRNKIIPAPFWRFALAGALLFAVVIESRVYASKYILQEALNHSARGRQAEAEKAFARSAELAPWRPEPQLQQGQLELSIGNLEGSQEHFKSVLKLRPNAPDALLVAAQASLASANSVMGDLQKKEELLEQAKQYIQKALEICPMLPQGHEILGKAYLMDSVQTNREAQEKNWSMAEEHLLLAIEYGARNPAELYSLVSQIQVAREDYDAAEEMLVRAVQADSASPAAWNSFMAFAHERRRYDRIESTLYNQLSRLENKRANSGLLAALYLRLAEVLMNGNGSPEAIEDAYRGAARHAPEEPEVWAQFGRYAVSERRLEGLRDALAEGCTKLREQENGVPTQLKYIEAIDALFRRQGEVLEDAVATLAASVRAHSPIARITAAQQYGWAAQILLNTARNLDDTPCSVWLSLGLICGQIENLPVADTLFEKADACLPDEQRPYLIVHWSDTLAGLGRENEAIEKLEAGVEMYPESLDIQWQYARQLAGVGRNSDAKKQYDSILERDDLGEEIRTLLNNERGKL